MNVYELDGLSLQYIRRNVDTASRTELSPFFLTAYNEVYRRIMAESYKIFAKETVTLDSAHSFSTDSFANELLGIRKIISHTGERLLWERSVGKTVTVRTNSTSVAVIYNYMPSLLENATPTSAPVSPSDTNTPVIPAEYHNIFSLWAAYRYLHSRRKFDEASCYYEMSTELVSKIKSNISERIKLKISYNG